MTERVTGLDVAMFAAELAVYAAVAAAAWHLVGGRGGVAVACGGVLAMALWWGLVHSPKARVRLPRPVDLALRCLWFLIGAAAAAGLVS